MFFGRDGSHKKDSTNILNFRWDISNFKFLEKNSIILKTKITHNQNTLLFAITCIETVPYDTLLIPSCIMSESKSKENANAEGKC